MSERELKTDNQNEDWSKRVLEWHLSHSGSKGQSSLRPMRSVDNFTLYHYVTSSDRRGMNLIESFCPSFFIHSYTLSWDQVIRSESVDIDWKEKIALYNSEIDPFWHGLTLRIMSTSESEGLFGKLGNCLCMKSRICKYLKKKKWLLGTLKEWVNRENDAKI